MLALLNKLYNLVCLIGWVAIQFLSTNILLSNSLHLKQLNSEMFALPILLLLIFQNLQVLDIFFILVKISKGSLLGSIAQIVGRLVVTWLYVSTDIAPTQMANVLIAWSLADANRYLYYLKKTPLTLWLRYNAFILLYPVGIYGEMTLMNNYLLINEGKLSENFILFVRTCQILIFSGFLFLYVYMFKNRSKALASLKNTQEDSKQKSTQRKKRN